jgi:hypothetical protein
MFILIEKYTSISIQKDTSLNPQLQKDVPFYRKKSVVVPVEIFQNNSSLYQDVMN